MPIEFKTSKKERIIALIILVTIFAYFILLPAYPNFLFQNKLEYKNYTIHFNDNLDKEALLSIIEIADVKLQKSEFYNENIESQIYICNNNLLYVLLNPTNYKGFASNRIRYKNIFIANIDLDNNLAITPFDNTRTEPISNLLAHEITHGLVKYNLGTKMSEWKEEGYADYIAYDRHVNLEEEYKDSLNPNYWYIKRKSMVYYLLNTKKTNFQEFVKTDYDFEKLEFELNDLLK